MNYVVMDTNNIVLWVSVCVRNMQDCFGSIVKLYGKLIKVKLIKVCRLIRFVF